MEKSNAETRKNVRKTLTVTVQAGSRLPKSSEMLIKVEISTIAEKLFEKLLKFKDESFGAIKIFKNFFSAKISPEMNRKLTGNDIFQITNRVFWALEIHNSCQR